MENESIEIIEDNNKKKGNKRPYVIVIVMALLLVVTITATSYAYFTANVSGTGQNNVVTTTSLEIEFTDGPQVALENATPGSYVEKTFKVENKGSGDTPYDIYMSDLINNFADKTDLVYTLTSSDGGANVVQTQIPDVNTKIVSNQIIRAGQTHNYVLRITFKETNDNQDDNKGKQFSTVIRINEVKAAMHQVTLHPNEGILDNTTISLPIGEIINNIPTPTRNGYNFEGWYLDSELTQKVTNETVMTTSINDLYAKYRLLPKATEAIQGLVFDANSTSTDVIGDTGLAYDGTSDNNLRYVGANPNNYVSFNNELWRIIGVMNNIENSSGQVQSLVKIIRDKRLGSFSWDSSASGVNNGWGVNEWSQADLMQELNNDYLGNVTIGTDGKWYTDNNNVKSTIIPSTIISSETQNQIESVVWKTGSPNNDNGTFVDFKTDVFTTQYSYTHERANTNGKICTSGDYCNDTVTRTSSWTGKVGLMYPSDYGYATSGGNVTNRQTCLGLGLNGWSNNCKYNDWLIPVQGVCTWTLSPFTNSSYSYAAFGIDLQGGVYPTGAGRPVDVYPVVFLKSTISITGGDGSSTNPYTIG